MDNHTCKNINSGRNFTLIEMLVVIAIIAILASMMAPSLVNSINSARALNCMNNQKQVSAAQMLYAEDYNSWVFTGWLEPGNLWPSSLFGEKFGTYSFPTDYTGGNKDIGFCPSQYPFRYTINWRGPNMSYGMDKQFYMKAERNYRVMSTAAGTYMHYVNLKAVKKPSQRFSFTDSSICGTAWNATILANHNQYSQIDSISWCNPDFRRGTHLRHFDRANSAFADGHVEAVGIDGLIDLGVKKMVTSDYEELNL